jgi:catechol 2,3-dioxygenase
VSTVINGPRVKKVAHVVLAVSDVARSKAFYRDALGMEIVSDRPNEGPSAFMSFGTQHHDIALFQAPPGAQRGELGLVHVACQIEGGPEQLKALRQRVIDMGAEVKAQQFHGITKSVYFSDPDGNTIEIFCETMGPEQGVEYMRAQQGYGVTEPLTL